MRLSAYLSESILKSPNGKYEAKVVMAGEIGMGSATSGLLIISNGIKIDKCNTSMAWSEDSKFLVIPKWSNDYKQKILMINIEEFKIYETPDIYNVIEIEEIKHGKIIGIDRRCRSLFKINNRSQFPDSRNSPIGISSQPGRIEFIQRSDIIPDIFGIISRFGVSPKFGGQGIIFLIFIRSGFSLPDQIRNVIFDHHASCIIRCLLSGSIQFYKSGKHKIKTHCIYCRRKRRTCRS